MKRRDIINEMERTLLRLPVSRHYAADDRTSLYVHHLIIGHELYEVSAALANDTLSVHSSSTGYQSIAMRRVLYEGQLTPSSFDDATSIVADNCVDMV